jgi:fucose permease
MLFLAATFILTVFTSGQNLCGNTLIASAFAGDRGSKLNLMHVFFGLCSFLAAFCLPLITSDISWREIFIVLAFLFLLALAWFPFYRFKEQRIPARADAAGFWSLLKNPALQKISLVVIFSTGCETAVSNWLVYTLEDGICASSGFAGGCESIFFAGLALGRIGGSYLARRNLLDKILIPLAFFQAVLAVCAIIFLPVLPWLFAATGLTVSVYFPTFYYKATHLCPAPGSGAIYLIMSGFGLAFFTFMVGVVGDLFTIRWGLLVAPLCALLLIPSLYSVRKEERLS